jgi:glyoxylase-like metal-dependent hydrolase (beta-lactamase superfamily II)
MSMSARSPKQAWFDVEPLAAGVTAIAEPFHVEHVISYLIEGDEQAILLDTGMGVGDLAALVRDLTSLPIAVVNSHAHWDHIGANWRFDEITIHHAEAHRLPHGVTNEELAPWLGPESLTAPPPPPFDRSTVAIPPSHATRLLSGGERLDLGGRRLDVIHTPGHSPGGIVLLDEANGLLFSTDVAYPDALYAFGEDADWPAYLVTMRMLAGLVPSVSRVFGSHTSPEMAPSMLADMLSAMELIDAGRPPDEQRPDRDVHRFSGFSVYRPSTLNGERGDS